MSEYTHTYKCMMVASPQFWDCKTWSWSGCERHLPNADGVSVHYVAIQPAELIFSSNAWVSRSYQSTDYLCPCFRDDQRSAVALTPFPTKASPCFNRRACCRSPGAQMSMLEIDTVSYKSHPVLKGIPDLTRLCLLMYVWIHSGILPVVHN